MIKLLFISVFFLLINYPVRAQVGGVLPGITCGTAGGPSGSDQCCYSSTPSLNSIPLPPGVSLPPLQMSQTPCTYGSPSTSDPSDPSCKCVLKISPIPMYSLQKLCAAYLKGNELQACNNCAIGGGLWTGLGCIPLALNSFVTDYILPIGIGFAGVLALFCIVYGAFRIETSRGNPEVIKKAQETLTSCIIGLMLIIFSVFLLRLIGVDILRIPGFTK